MSVKLLDEIRKIRGEQELSLNLRNTNRYAVVANERGHLQTAYFFGAPIYNKSNRKLVSGGFSEKNDCFAYTGSNSIILVSRNEIQMRDEKSDEPENFSMTVSTDLGELYLKNGELESKTVHITPSLNGIRVETENKKGGVTLCVHTDHPYSDTRNNTKCFVLMKEQFRPYAVINAIGRANDEGNITSPATVESEYTDCATYRVNISSNEKGGRLVFEICLYEEKLMQDTTVESGNPIENNAFGASGFIGESKEFGSQWLYSRVDVSKLSVVGRKIASARLYIPALSKSELPLDAYRISKRFCSFGSVWSEKVAVTEKAVTAERNGDYYIFDLTEIVTDENHRLKDALLGLVIRTRGENGGFTAIATGDCSMPCQILEIRYKR